MNLTDPDAIVQLDADLAHATSLIAGYVMRLDQAIVRDERHVPPPVGPDERGYYKHPPTTKRRVLVIPLDPNPYASRGPGEPYR